MMNHWKKMLCVGVVAASSVGCGGTSVTGSTGTTGTTSDAGSDANVDPCSVAPAAQTVGTNITTDTTWCANTTVTLSARIYVENDANLTIQPGVTVKGMNGSALVVTRHGHLSALGTVSSPIVMTSSLPAGSRSRGDWGGLVFFGRAPNNAGTDVTFEGLFDEERNKYGGTDAAWDCGQLAYVRVEFAGQVFAPNKEFNGITYASCGTATNASYVQIHNGADDGIEFFGGSANVDHAVITGADDDGLDYDNGWNGHIQYYIVQHTAAVGDNAIEADNNASGTTATPRSQPRLYNVSFFGNTMKSRKITIRRASLGLIHNAIFQDFGGGLQVEPPLTTNESSLTFAANWPSTLVFQNSYFATSPVGATVLTNSGDVPQLDPNCVPSVGVTCPKDTSIQGTFDQLTLVSAAARNNTLNAPALVTIGSDSTPNFCPAAGTVAVVGATAPTNWASFDSAGLAFAGACAPGTTPANAWYAGWTSFPVD